METSFARRKYATYLLHIRDGSFQIYMAVRDCFKNTSPTVTLESSRASYNAFTTIQTNRQIRTRPVSAYTRAPFGRSQTILRQPLRACI